MTDLALADYSGRRDSNQAQELTRDPYALKFLAIDSDVSERELEQRLIDRMLEAMRERGPGFAFGPGGIVRRHS